MLESAELLDEVMMNVEVPGSCELHQSRLQATIAIGVQPGRR